MSARALEFSWCDYRLSPRSARFRSSGLPIPPVSRALLIVPGLDILGDIFDDTAGGALVTLLKTRATIRKTPDASLSVSMYFFLVCLLFLLFLPSPRQECSQEAITNTLRTPIPGFLAFFFTTISAYMEPDKTYNVWARTIPDWAVVDDPLDIDCNDRTNPGLRAGPYAPAYYAGDLFRDDIYRLERLAEGIITRHVDYNRKFPALLFALLCIHTHWVFGPPSSAHSFIPQFIHLDIHISLSLMIYCGCFS